jgi:hypothetical protein
MKQGVQVQGYVPLHHSPTWGSVFHVRYLSDLRGMRNGTGMSYYENYMVFNISQLRYDLVLHSYVACRFARIPNSVHASGSNTVSDYPLILQGKISFPCLYPA